MLTRTRTVTFTGDDTEDMYHLHRRSVLLRLFQIASLVSVRLHTNLMVGGHSHAKVPANASSNNAQIAHIQVRKFILQVDIIECFSVGDSERIHKCSSACCTFGNSCLDETCAGFPRLCCRHNSLGLDTDIWRPAQRLTDGVHRRHLSGVHEKTLKPGGGVEFSSGRVA
eukprot:1186247-Prorocentrum_minimum.AAC.1